MGTPATTSNIRTMVSRSGAPKLTAALSELAEAILDSRVSVERFTEMELIGTKRYPRTRFHIVVEPKGNA